MEYKEAKERMIKSAVRNLKDFGYYDVDEINIFTVPIFREFFKIMLKDTKDEHRNRHDIVKLCDDLLWELT